MASPASDDEGYFIEIGFLVLFLHANAEFPAILFAITFIYCTTWILSAALIVLTLVSIFTDLRFEFP